MTGGRFIKAVGLCAAFVAFPAAWLAFFYVVDHGPGLPPELAVEHAAYTLSFKPEPPVGADWQPVALPNDVPAPASPFVSVWYRIPLPERPADGGTWAVYLQSPRASVDVFLGGVSLHSTGPVTLPLVFRRAPLLVSFDSELLVRLEPQYLYIRLTRTPHTAGSGPIYLGPAAPLAESYRAAMRLTREVPLLIAAVTGAMVLLLLALSLMNAAETAYAWLAVTLTVWASHTLCDLVSDLPIDHWLWFGLIYLQNAWVLTVVVVFNRLYGFRARRVEAVMWWTSLPLATGLLMVAIDGDGPTLFGYATYIWGPWILFWALFTLGQHAWAIRREANFESVGLMLHGWTAFVIGVRDFLFDIAPHAVPGTSLYLRFYAAFSMLFLTLLLARRFVGYQRRSEAFSDSLQHEVAQVSQELEDNYRRLSRLEHERAVTEERARMTRDMHDGLGAHLVHALTLAERDPGAAPVRQALEAALQDLRLIVDAGAPGEDELVILLASFRHRSAKAIARSGLTVRWQVEPLPARHVGPENALHLLRILQEALTNILRHARARVVSVEAREMPEGICIRVCDDGVGFDVGAQGGKGLRHLRQRAAALGAALCIVSQPGRTCVELLLPLPETGAASTDTR